MTSPQSPISPEERAGKLLDAVSECFTPYLDLEDGVCVAAQPNMVAKIIAQAIRQAENDALERAAEEIEMRAPTTQDCASSALVEACDILAAAIRSLKHKDTP